MAEKYYDHGKGLLKPIVAPRKKGDKDPNKPMSEQKKTATTKKKVKRK